MSRRTPLLCAAFVLLCVAIAHGGGLDGGFVYDDHRFIVQNEAIASLDRPLRFFTDPGTASAAQGVTPDVYRPLRTLDFATDRALFGLRPFGWHLESVLLHGLNALLVGLLLLRVLGGFGSRAALFGATLAAGLFAAHPATVESVAWLSSRGDLLAWTFVLLAFEVLHRPGAVRTGLGVVLVALACLAKESAIVAWALLPLRDLAMPAATRPPARTTWIRTLLLAAVTASYFAVRLHVMPSADDLPLLAQTAFPSGGREAALRGALASLGWYLRVLVLPTGFPFDRNVYTDPVPLSWGEPSVVLGLAILSSLLLVGVGSLRGSGGLRTGDRREGRDVFAFACIGALIAWVPVSSVLVPLKAFAAERFLYPILPCLAAGLAAYGVAASTRLAVRGRVVLFAAAFAALSACIVLSVRRTRSWHDDATLWAAVQRDEPMNPRAYEGLGFLRLSEGRLQAAERAFSTYREFQPYDGKVHAELAATFRHDYEVLSTTAASLASAPGRDRMEAPPFLLRQAIYESRAAMEAWSRAGLDRGRGDKALVRSNLEGWRAAALDYGDLGEARRANELLAIEDRAGGGPEAYPQRRMRVVLASLALTMKAPARDSPAALRQDLARRAVRAELLADLQIDPALSDPVALAALLPRLDALLIESPGDEAVRRNRVQALMLGVEGLEGAARAVALEVLDADLTVLAKAHPEDRGIADTLRAVRARRP